MYFGSTLNFIAYSMLNKSVIGFVFSLFIALVYKCGDYFEMKLMNEIYSNTKKNY